MKRVMIVMAALLLVVTSSSGQADPRSLAIQPGAIAPELKPTEWFSETPDLKGKFIALDFWGITCKPCIAGFPKVNKLHHKYKDKVAFIAVTSGDPRDVYTFDGPAHEFYSMISEQADKDFKIYGIPHMVLIDPKGIVRFSGNGFDLTEEKLLDFINKYGK